VVNTSFGGLKSDEALKLSSFFHLRPVDKLRKHTKFALSELDKTIEFLDPLNEDFPSGCWSLVSEPLTSQARAWSCQLAAALLCLKACRGGVSPVPVWSPPRVTGPVMLFVVWTARVGGR